MEEATQLAEFIPNMKVRVIYNHDDTYDAKGYDPEVVRKLIKADLDERTLGSINHEGEGFSLVYNNHQKGNNELSLHFREYTPVVEEILKRIEL